MVMGLSFRCVCVCVLGVGGGGVRVPHVWWGVHHGGHVSLDGGGQKRFIKQGFP